VLSETALTTPGSASLLPGRLIVRYLYGATRGTVPTPLFAPCADRRSPCELRGAAELVAGPGSVVPRPMAPRSRIYSLQVRVQSQLASLPLILITRTPARRD
jgi:hypothetical protein